MKTHMSATVWITDDAIFQAKALAALGHYVTLDGPGGGMTITFTNIGGADPIANMRRLRDAMSDHLFVHDPEGEGKAAA